MNQRNFQFDKVKVKKKHFFGAAQNVKLFFKDIFITNFIIVYYIEPFFSLREESAFVEQILAEEGELYKNCRQEIKIGNKTIYFAISNQFISYLDLEDENNPYWEDPFYPSLSFIFRLSTSKSFDKKFKDFGLDFYKNSFLKDNRLIVEKFKNQLLSNKGDVNNIKESMVDHISKEKKLNLFPFFQQEDFNELIFGFSNRYYSYNGVVTKTDYLIQIPESFQKNEFITDLEEYKNLLVDFYGEKGKFCRYTNVDKNFINNFKSKFELMYLDMVLGGGYVAEGYPRLNYYPFSKGIDESSWIIIKNIVEKFKQINNQ